MIKLYRNIFADKHMEVFNEQLEMKSYISSL